MYDNTIKDQFVTLRAAGKSFGDISEQLGVVKSTLHRWEEEREADIARLRRIEWEELEAELGWRFEDQLAELNSSIDAYEMHLRRFSTHHLSLRDTVMLLRETRRQRDRLRALLMGTPSRCKKSVESVPFVVEPTCTKSNETERSQQNGSTEHRNTNDLQQPPSESFDSVTPDVRRGHFSNQPLINPNPQSADAVHDSTTPNHQSPTRQSLST